MAGSSVGVPPRGQEPADGSRSGGDALSSLERLFSEGRIEKVAADRERARAKLEEAVRHLQSSAVIADDDPEGAYALLYDAARKAVDAHVSASGYRTSKARPGAHEAVAIYARHVITGEYAEDAHALDGMRKQRNRAEYGTWHISKARLQGDRAHAERIVEAVGKELSGREA